MPLAQKLGKAPAIAGMKSQGTGKECPMTGVGEIVAAVSSMPATSTLLVTTLLLLCIASLRNRLSCGKCRLV
ncbi:MAG: hypothetical protein DI528_05750 [Shinella sp.]|nr:MAG: hypothetical protein DI528_05750 [Shinella sp.]